MKRKDNGKSLGRSLIKDRFGTNRDRRNKGDVYLHTAELEDGYNWGLLNLQSVTEESSFQEFLNTAELVGTEFQAEKLNVKFINTKRDGLLSSEKRKEVDKKHEQFVNFLNIPRRPQWNKLMTSSELSTKEKTEFFEWRRKLATLQETENLIITPYEKNLEFWRQLWRVIERSDIVVQIVDARNPLLFRCKDLELYVIEVDPNKINMLLINKADFLTDKQREIWTEYFSANNILVAFFSAIIEEEIVSSVQENLNLNIDSLAINIQDKVNFNEVTSISDINEQSTNFNIKNSSTILTREKLISLFKSIGLKLNKDNKPTVVGLIGYPNVGKSSTINNLLKKKKVSVSATPGKTKHFQTLYIDGSLLLCDCPGLVMPNFVNTKSEMILNGVLPIDQMTDYINPITLLCSLVPRHILENLYGIMIPVPPEDDPNRTPYAEEILSAHALNRGFMTQNGQPDLARSSRYILKDFVNGKLSYCVAPPGVNQNEFHTFSLLKENKELNQKSAKPATADIDKTFFKSQSSNAHSKGKININHLNSNFSTSESGSNLGCIEKPWKKINKHSKRNKHEKTRRLYAHLDKH